MTTTFERQVKGLLGTKLGMTQVWDENGKFVPVTVVKADSNVVTQLRNEDKDGYNAVQIGFGAIDPRKVTKPVTGQYAAAGVNPRRHLAELRLDDEGAAAGCVQRRGVDEDGVLAAVVGPHAVGLLAEQDAEADHRPADHRDRAQRVDELALDQLLERRGGPLADSTQCVCTQPDSRSRDSSG